MFHPDGMAVLELVALLIREDRYHDAMVNTPYSGFGRVAFNAKSVSGKKNNAVHSAFIDAARRVGVLDVEIARYAMLEHGLQFEFGWTDTKEVLQDGWVLDPRLLDKEVPVKLTKDSPFEELVWNLSDGDLANLMISEKPLRVGNGRRRVPWTLVGSVARFRAECLSLWMEKAAANELGCLSDWQYILRATNRFDDWFVEYAGRKESIERFLLLMIFSGLREGRCADLARLAAVELEHATNDAVILFLSDYFPVDLADRLRRAIQHDSTHNTPVYSYDRSQNEARRPSIYDQPHWILRKAFRVSSSVWDLGGEEVFGVIVSVPYLKVSGWNPPGIVSLYSIALNGLLTAETPPAAEIILKWAKSANAAISAANVDSKEINGLREAFWLEAAGYGPRIFRSELMTLLGDKLVTLRQIAARGLETVADPEMVIQTLEMILRGKVDQKLGAADLIGKIGDASCISPLEEAVMMESNNKVRAVMHEALNEIRTRMESSVDDQSTRSLLVDLEASFAKQISDMKWAAPSWLRHGALPPLMTKDGSTLSSDAVAFLMAKQSKHKNMEAAPHILPLLAHIDCGKSAPFAAALVEGFLSSSQVTADRWALTLAGMLGDSRIIPPLLSQIQDWCIDSRRRLAEYAVQAIALLPGDEPLMVLGALSNRYRTQYKNVGKSCEDAFIATATARGVTPDELGDLVVPDFGFGFDGIRHFEWDTGGVGAELGANFKLSWFDLPTEGILKSLPANVPDEIKIEVKTLGKLLRETVKAQTVRLEASLIQQRRWSVARWRELFENHPLLRLFACGLVWGIYDTSGKLLRTFRRYGNGILADAKGKVEELQEIDFAIGMVHPLELDSSLNEEWRIHFGRMKVTPADSNC